MDPKSPLEEPHQAAFAWARYRRLMAGMAGMAFVATTAALTWLYLEHGMVSIHFFIATAGGIFLSVMLGAALMGLVFLSAGTGHDDVITDRLEEDRNRDNS